MTDIVYKKSNIKQSKEFDLETCFDDEKQIFTLESGIDYYFDSYGHFGIHEEMLKDKERTNAYRKAITQNPQLFENKIVLDIGCGTGILSIFAAQAGAKHVYGVELASIATHAKQIIELNKLQDKITIIRGKVEEIELPVEKVDIIISEWMGYFLLFESMFDTVIYARDKWLSKDGFLFPDKAKMYIACVEDETYKKRKIDFWNKVYGVDMSIMKQWALLEPQIDNIDKKQIISDYCCFQDFDLETVTKEDMDFTTNYKINIKENDNLSGLASWFDCYFTHGTNQVLLSTSPFYKSTHWKQTLFYLRKSQPVKKGDHLRGSICVKRNKKNPREIDVKISYQINNDLKTKEIQFFHI